MSGNGLGRSQRCARWRGHDLIEVAAKLSNCWVPEHARMRPKLNLERNNHFAAISKLLRCTGQQTSLASLHPTSPRFLAQQKPQALCQCCGTQVLAGCSLSTVQLKREHCLHGLCGYVSNTFKRSKVVKTCEYPDCRLNQCMSSVSNLRRSHFTNEVVAYIKEARSLFSCHLLVALCFSFQCPARTADYTHIHTHVHSSLEGVTPTEVGSSLTFLKLRPCLDVLHTSLCLYM